jgi:hypothetical protein
VAGLQRTGTAQATTPLRNGANPGTLIGTDLFRSRQRLAAASVVSMPISRRASGAGKCSHRARSSGALYTRKRLELLNALNEDLKV